MGAVSPLSDAVCVQILYNAAQGRYVLLFHADTASFDYNVVGVAVSASNITGPYTFVRTFHPDGLNSLDMGVFQVCLPLPTLLFWRISTTGAVLQVCDIHDPAAQRQMRRASAWPCVSVMQQPGQQQD